MGPTKRPGSGPRENPPVLSGELTETKALQLPDRECDRCGQRVDGNTWREQTIEGTDGKIRHCCNECFAYYKSKPTTTRTSVREPRANFGSKGVDINAIYSNTLSARRPGGQDLGRKQPKVAALPTEGTRLTDRHLSPPAKNPYEAKKRSTTENHYGYTDEHAHYEEEKRRYAKRQKDGTSSNLFAVKVQAFYAPEIATPKTFCLPLKNFVETIMVAPTTMGTEIATAARSTIERALKRNASAFRHFTWDTQKAAVRDPSSGVDLEEHSDVFPEGYYWDKVMVASAAKKKGASAFNAPTAPRFKAPKSTPVVGVIYPFAQYQAYLDHLEMLEMADASHGSDSEAFCLHCISHAW
ncbi:hypothetical protein DFP72DRAFT_1068118 [Ephemerocybe angulata]|uniref:Uncharacterized protein n=1 Tax=Ephemerocybe angulata TaxID=980116 RepID=A0A8H6HXD3_9AGAR|nr:hypothetical protein DFP72DRAFT_1068118 [Tulosesus angulatus]